MDRSVTQGKIFTIAAVLLLISALSMAAIIPALLLEPSPDFLPVQSAIGTFIGMSIHLVVFIGLLRGIRLTKRQSVIKIEINYLLAFGFIVLGIGIMDGAFTFLNEVLFVSIGMFLCALCDLVAAVVFIVAIILLSKRKAEEPD